MGDIFQDNDNFSPYKAKSPFSITMLISKNTQYENKEYRILKRRKPSERVHVSSSKNDVFLENRNKKLEKCLKKAKNGIYGGLPYNKTGHRASFKIIMSQSKHSIGSNIENYSKIESKSWK